MSTTMLLPSRAAVAFFSPRLVSTAARRHQREKPSSSLANRDEDSLVSGEAELSKKKASTGLFGTSTVPISINYPNRRGIPGHEEIEHDLKEVLKEGPGILKDHLKQLGTEIASIRGSIEKDEMIEALGTLKDDEARVEYRFDSPEALALWKTGCDSDWNEGFSKAETVLTDRKTALFRGEISSRIVRDGRVERAGWASIKLDDTGAFRRRKYLRRWENFSHLLVKCRGDGRSYKVMLHSPLHLDVSWGDSHSYSLHTHGGPYWQYERIPFSKFIHTVAGRIQDRQYPVNLADASSVSFVLMDRIDGPFQLELDWVGVVQDRAHMEKHAYETYTLPMFNTHGF